MNDDDNLIQNLQDKVKASQKELDAETLGQLRAARRTALESFNASSKSWWQLPVTQFAVAATFVVALTVGILLPLSNTQDEIYDVDLIALSEDIEMLEDLDFYLWVSEAVENES